MPLRPLNEAPVEATLAAGECHRYGVAMQPGQALDLHVEQDGVDVEIRIGPEDGGDTVEFDSPEAAKGRDGGTHVARAGGETVVQVCAPAALEAPGVYWLRREPLRAATERDLLRDRAFRAYREGKRLQTEGRRAAARRAFEEALATFRRAGSLREQGWTLYKLAGLAEVERDLVVAAGGYRQAAELHRRAGDARQRMRNLGWAARASARRPDFESASALYREMYALASELGDTESACTALAGEGNAHAWRQSPLEAADRYRELIDLGRRTGDPRCEVDGHALLGRLYRTGGDPRQALAEYGRALAVAQEAALSKEMADARAGIGACLLELGQPRLALRHLQEASALVEPGGRSHELQVDLARAYRRLGDHQSAIAAFKLALESPPTALAEANVRINLARLHADAGDPDAAIAACERALPVALEHGNRLHVASAFACLADNLRTLGRRHEALAAVQQAVEQVEALRSEFAREDLRASFFSDKHRYFELYVDLLLDVHGRDGRQGLLEEAFEVAERSKARTLLDGLERGREAFESATDPELLARREALEREIAGLEVAALRGDTHPATATRTPASQGRLIRLKGELATLRGEIVAGHEGWKKALSLTPADYETVRRELVPGDDVQLVSYFLGRERSVVWVLGSEGIAVRELPARSLIEKAAERTAVLMAKTHEAHRRGLAELEAASLADQVLAPVAGLLTARRLVLIKEGALDGVPFAALPWPGDPARGELVVDRFELVEVPSASTAIALRSTRRHRPADVGGPAVIADGVYASEDWRARVASGGVSSGVVATAAAPSPRRAIALDELPRLPATRAEAEAIASLFPRQALVALDFDASLDLVRSGRLRRYRMIHFATHGIVENGVAALVLSQWSRDGRRTDGLLSEREVYDLDLGADLVVLSSCRSGLGRRLPGEGVLGLTRAFLWAGASTVVVSLWNVDDAATAALMTRFYQELAGGRATPVEALARAQRALRRTRRWSAPHYWAGFVVQGSWD